MASNNITTVTSRSSYGLKFAKAGFDVRTAGDYELLFDSSWPSLAIAFSTTVTTITNGIGSIGHPLGFPPFTMAWCFEGGIVTRRYFPNISSTTISFSDALASNTIYYVQCYNLDISKQVSYDYIPTPPAQIGVYDPNYGAKFAKPGQEINSKDLNNFIFHTRAMSPAILSVNTTFDKVPAIANSQTITTVSPANYVPWVFGYDQSFVPGEWQYAFPYAQAAPRLFVNLVQPNSFTMSGTAGSSGGSLIVLRDPLFVANTVNVTY